MCRGMVNVTSTFLYVPRKNVAINRGISGLMVRLGTVAYPHIQVNQFSDEWLFGSCDHDNNPISKLLALEYKRCFRPLVFVIPVLACIDRICLNVLVRSTATWIQAMMFP